MTYWNLCSFASSQLLQTWLWNATEPSKPSNLQTRPEKFQMFSVGVWRTSVSYAAGSIRNYDYYVFFWCLVFITFKAHELVNRDKRIIKVKTPNTCKKNIILISGFKKEKIFQGRWRWPLFLSFMKEPLPQSWKKSVLSVSVSTKKYFCAMCSEGQQCVSVPISLPSQAALLLRNSCWSIHLDVSMHV